VAGGLCVLTGAMISSECLRGGHNLNSIIATREGKKRAPRGVEKRLPKVSHDRGNGN